VAHSKFDNPPGPTVILMMSEVGARPLAHAWAKQPIEWWNRMVSRKNGDMVKEALRESVCRAVGGRLAKQQNCWASALIFFLRALDKGPNLLASLPLLPTSIVDDLHKRWQQHA
jgi:hypothetical protein